ncbi:MAG: 3-hydroxyacyl-CoA dehydrogenase [Rhizobiales bacterium]|nr:3-hydroxyacyl-CoA dehydrogenase [Hyphomicrobiales bacterium]
MSTKARWDPLGAFEHPIGELQDWRYYIDMDGIAWAIFDRAGESANTLGRRPTEELALILANLDETAGTGRVKGLVIASAKPRSFISGADIREFDGYSSETAVAHEVSRATAELDRIERSRVPIVAAISGYCLGGGLELAMACQYRIADRAETTRLGLPEVKLGIFPGLNGTVRSIRLAGAPAAMEMMLTGRMLRPEAARAMGLVDQLVASPDRLRWAARKAILRGIRPRREKRLHALMRQSPIRGMLVKRMRAATAEKARKEHYPAPFALIDLFEQFGGDLTRMKAAETRAFAPLMVSPQARALRRVFRLSELLKEQAPKSAEPVRRVHVIGAGTMGADIAAHCVAQGLAVTLQDLSSDALEAARTRAYAHFAKRFRRSGERKAAESRLELDGAGNGVERADVVIEAIVERLEPKQQLFASLEPRMKPGAIMASNTSSLPIEKIAAGLVDPARLIGLHFFNPVPQLPLVEVVRSPLSRDVDIGRGCAFVTAIGKFPLVTKSTPGFLVNRVLAPYMLGAMQRFERGDERERIDEAARVFGMPMGPLELADQVGLDICMHVGEILGLETGGPESKAARLVAAGKLGKKTGEGFYVWKDGKPKKGKIDFETAELQVLGRELIAPLIDECEKCLEEGVVADGDMVDAGVVFGTGFAPFRGGPLHYRATGDWRHARIRSEAA